MFLNIVLVTFVSVFIAVAAYGHVLLFTAIVSVVTILVTVRYRPRAG